MLLRISLVVQGGYPLVYWRFSTEGEIPSVHWRLFNTVRGIVSSVGETINTVRGIVSSVKDDKYDGGIPEAL